MRKKSRARRKIRKKIINRWRLILLCVVGVIVIAAAVTWNPGESEQPRVPAEEYFSISNIMYYGEEQNNSIFVYQIWFELTAAQGDAHEVYITNLPGYTEYIDVGNISQNQTEGIEINLYTPVYVFERNGRFPFSFRISCHEAYGEITIYLE